MAEVRLSQIIAPVFREVWKLVKKKAFTHWWFKGGRSSTKSSFISICIVLLIMSDPEANAMCFRKVGDTLSTSVYEQLLWAIDILGVTDYFHCTTSPMRITYTPTGQRILFRGLDDAKKTKSVKLRRGYFKIVWFEELDEFSGMEEVRKATQSLLRGGDEFLYFYSYNPPINSSNWVNVEAAFPREDRNVHHSTYLDVPPEWLGPQTIIEAEHLKRQNLRAYEHEYLGKAVGTGGTIFPNVKPKIMSAADIAKFDHIRHGIDWGYVVDPFAFIVWHIDHTRRCLYIFDEIHEVNLLNTKAITLVRKKVYPNVKIVADSAEPKSIKDFKLAGLYITGAEKGPGSVEHGIKWLQDLEAIYIDPIRCPKTFKEFSTYELEKNKSGEWKDAPPDKNNHSIDAVRYGSEQDMKGKGAF